MRLVPRRISGTCARHQKQITVAVKRARVLALLMVYRREDLARALERACRYRAFSCIRFSAQWH